jgi:1-acyl-sn-glycerol-3-phosphate acyltransferase
MLMRRLKAVYFWPMAFFVTLGLFLVVLWRQALVVLLRRPRDGRPIHGVASLWGRALVTLTPGWRVDIEGREHLPNTAPGAPPIVIVANHESMADIWAMYYLGIQFRWLSKIEVFKVPMVGPAMRWAKYVPIKRGDPASHGQAMAASAARLREGLPMFFFPEGTRSTDGRIKDFKLGAFKLARDAQAQILPIAIRGAGGLLPKGSMLPSRRAQVRLRILPPLPAPAATDDLEAVAAKSRELIMAAHAELAGA